jgi:DNA-binding XRE family transcriptional regulator
MEGYMRHNEVVASRAARDPAYGQAREARREQYEFRRALIGARINAGLTQDELAQSVGVTRSTIARLETGESNPTVETLKKLAGVLDIQFEIDDTGVRVREEIATAG